MNLRRVACCGNRAELFFPEVHPLRKLGELLQEQRQHGIVDAIRRVQTAPVAGPVLRLRHIPSGVRFLPPRVRFRPGRDEQVPAGGDHPQLSDILGPSEGRRLPGSSLSARRLIPFRSPAKLGDEAEGDAGEVEEDAGEHHVPSDFTSGFAEPERGGAIRLRVDVLLRRRTQSALHRRQVFRLRVLQLRGSLLDRGQVVSAAGSESGEAQLRGGGGVREPVPVTEVGPIRHQAQEILLSLLHFSRIRLIIKQFYKHCSVTKCKLLLSRIWLTRISPFK